jgi:hypothetical protein
MDGYHPATHDCGMIKHLNGKVVSAVFKKTLVKSRLL